MRIRPATIDDAHALAAVHIASCQGAYRGLLPDDYLDGLRVDRWQARWEQSLTANAWPVRGALLAESGGGETVGFVDLVPSRDGDAAAATGEVTSLYVVPEHWGAGIGRALMTGAVDRLREAGFAQATLWVLRDNTRARRFYELAGWATDGTQKDAVVAGVPVTEIRYRRGL
ncbi:MAG: N-acetyltransferase family protein [Blastococcus sp.]